MLDGNSYPILTANLIRLGHFPSLNLQGGYSTHGHHWGGLCLLPTLPFSSCSVVVFIPWEKRCSQCDKMHSRLYNIRKTEREGNWAAEREQLEHPSVMACYPSSDAWSFLREIVPLAPAFDQVRTLPFSGLTGVSFHTTFSTEDRSHEVVSAVLKDKVS